MKAAGEKKLCVYVCACVFMCLNFFLLCDKIDKINLRKEGFSLDYSLREGSIMVGTLGWQRLKLHPWSGNGDCLFLTVFASFGCQLDIVRNHLRRETHQQWMSVPLLHILY